ncbi:MAG TPA: S41 family peptidase [Chitinophagales bacterium]
MKNFKIKHWALGAVGVILLVSATLPQVAYFDITKQLDIFASLYRELNLYYVDTLNPEQLIYSGIYEMNNSLDPYTDFIPEDDLQEYRQQTTGRYGGIGALIGARKGAVIITDPYEDCPAAKAGLHPGDRLVEVDGKNVAKSNSDDVSKMLRGKAGTVLHLTIARLQADGKEKELKFSFPREEIKIKNVPFYGMLKDSIGYIRLNGFTDRAGTEVHNALTALVVKNKAKGIVFDLRGNPGGLLNEAINVANCFVSKNTPIVSTRGRMDEQNKEYKTLNEAVDTKIPLAILVDGNSASAAEIVSGSMQDLDRAVILGQRTYGKGLVQSTHSLPYNAKVKITTAKYYIPSGRCIQAINYADKKDGHAERKADSLKVAFKTKDGRSVYDGVGIDPDVKTDEEKASQVIISLYMQNLFFEYAMKYRATHEAIPTAKNFKLTDAEYDDFIKYVNSQLDFKYTTRSEKLLDDLKKSAEKEQIFKVLETQYNAMQAELKREKEQDFAKNKKHIKRLLEEEICSHYYLNAGRIERTVQEDEDVLRAIEVLKNTNERDSILQVKK